MDWTTFIAGFLSALFTFALFKGQKADDYEIIDAEAPSRYVELSCGTCRKFKRHREIEPNLYECERCGRHVDLRVSNAR